MNRYTPYQVMQAKEELYLLLNPRNAQYLDSTLYVDAKPYTSELSEVLPVIYFRPRSSASSGKYHVLSTYVIKEACLLNVTTPFAVVASYPVARGGNPGFVVTGQKLGESYVTVLSRVISKICALDVAAFKYEVL